MSPSCPGPGGHGAHEYKQTEWVDGVYGEKLTRLVCQHCGDVRPVVSEARIVLSEDENDWKRGLTVGDLRRALNNEAVPDDALVLTGYYACQNYVLYDPADNVVRIENNE